MKRSCPPEVKQVSYESSEQSYYFKGKKTLEILQEKFINLICFTLTMQATQCLRPKPICQKILIQHC